VTKGVGKIVGTNVDLERQKSRSCPHDSALPIGLPIYYELARLFTG
jgi:hypothetical protein